MTESLFLEINTVIFIFVPFVVLIFRFILSRYHLQYTGRSFKISTCAQGRRFPVSGGTMEILRKLENKKPVLHCLLETQFNEARQSVSLFDVNSACGLCEAILSRKE